MDFHKKNFGQRFGMLGDMAERAFERWAISQELNYERLGFNRPALDRFPQVNPFLRSMPDFILETDKSHILVECKGTGTYFVKIKQETLDGLSPWDGWHDVYFFIWNSRLKKHAFLEYQYVLDLATRLEPLQFENDKKVYYDVEVDWDNQ